MSITEYDRLAAVNYAHQWAFGRNPAFYDYEEIGGDCTNFASQCLYAGSGVMDYTPTFGWYYISANRKAPAWTGVMYLYNYLLRSRVSNGPMGWECALEELEPGDLVQLSFDGAVFQHTPVVVSVGEPRSPDTVLLAAHSIDADDRPLSSYDYRRARYIHISGVRRL